jgi:hypothetical protein
VAKPSPPNSQLQTDLMMGSNGWYCALRMPAISYVLFIRYHAYCSSNHIHRTAMAVFWHFLGTHYLPSRDWSQFRTSGLPEIRQKEKCEIARCVPKISRWHFRTLWNSLIERTQCVRDAALLLGGKFLRGSLLDCRKAVPSGFGKDCTSRLWISRSLSLTASVSIGYFSRFLGVRRTTCPQRRIHYRVNSK